MSPTDIDWHLLKGYGDQIVRVSTVRWWEVSTVVTQKIGKG